MHSPSFPSRWLPYLLIAPSAILVVIFFIYPALQSLYLSLYRVNLVRGQYLYVGLENFERLLNSQEYINSLVTTGTFTLFVVVVGLSLSLLLALGASQRLRGFGVYRTLLIWPFALSPAIVGVIWALITDPTIGVLTNGLRSIGINFDRVTSSTNAFLFICIATTWNMLGYNIIFFLAGLKNIPSELLEAASLDGANVWVRFWRIVFPLLSPTTFFLLIMNTLYACFEVFGLIDVTTQGGPGRATNMLIYKLYNDGFKNINLIGSASAQSILLLIMVTTLTLLQFRFAGRRAFYR